MYNWEGMRKMTWAEVQKKAKTGKIVGCFYLYEDNTESEIGADYTMEELEKHYNAGVEFGEEKFNAIIAATTFEEVPKVIRDAVELVVKRFCITGVCDPMYICNRIAAITGNGNGSGAFTAYPRLSHKDWQMAARRVQVSYTSLISVDEIEELASIMENKKINVEIALPRLKEAHARYSDFLEKEEAALGARSAYLTSLVNAINSLIVDLTVEQNKQIAEEKKKSFRNEFQPILEQIGVEAFLEGTTWGWEGETAMCPAIKNEMFKNTLLPLVSKHYPEWITDETCLLIEYWEDKDKVIYLLDSGYDCKNISFELKNDLLEEKVKELCLAERSNT